MPRSYTGNERFEAKIASGEPLTRSEFMTYLRLRSQDFGLTHTDTPKPIAEWWTEFQSDFLPS